MATKSNFSKQTDWLPLSQLTPDPNNANTHNERSIRAIADSLLRFGMLKNVVADKHKVIRAGNGTYEAIAWIAACETDNSEDEQIRVQAINHGILRKELKPGKHKAGVTQLVPYIRCEVTNLEADEATAYALADNRTGQLSTLNLDTVSEQLRDLQNRVSVAGIGWDTSELTNLLAIKPETQPPDSFPSYDEEIETQYQCPKCTYCWSGKAK